MDSTTISFSVLVYTRPGVHGQFVCVQDLFMLAPYKSVFIAMQKLRSLGFLCFYYCCLSLDNKIHVDACPSKHCTETPCPGKRA